LIYDFGSFELGSESSPIVTILNSGNTNLEISDITFQSGSSSDYVIECHLW
jgi:hypothetical protein